MLFENLPLPEPLGIGVTYSAALPPELYQPELVDFVEITPEALCRTRAVGTELVLELVHDKMERARDTASHSRPLPAGEGVDVSGA